MNRARFEAFADGVFAFAATLLVSGIALPHFEHAAREAELFTAVVHQGPSLIAYVMGCSIVGIMWQQRHALVRIIDRIDPRTIFSCSPLLLAAHPKNRTSSFFLPCGVDDDLSEQP